MFNFSSRKSLNTPRVLNHNEGAIIFCLDKRVYDRVTFIPTSKPLLALAPYTYYDWFRLLNSEMGLQFN